VSPDQLTAAVGDTIQWFATTSSLAPWTVTLQAGTCREAAINQGQPLCTVQTAAPKSQSYSIVATTCTGTGNATLTVK
jgi:plastocyanin